MSIRELQYLAGVASALALVAGAAAAQPAGEAVYASAAQLKALTAHPKDGFVTAPAPSGPGVTVLAARRDRTGEPELHERLADQFVVQAGHAMVRVGGQLTGQRQVGPGEFRGGTIKGGRAYQLAPGDMLWIPPGQPHQVIPKGDRFRYLAFKFAAAPVGK